jgi:hypothetical protein
VPKLMREGAGVWLTPTSTGWVMASTADAQHTSEGPALVRVRSIHRSHDGSSVLLGKIVQLDGSCPWGERARVRDLLAQGAFAVGAAQVHTLDQVWLDGGMLYAPGTEEPVVAAAVEAPAPAPKPEAPTEEPAKSARPARRRK